MKKGDLIKSHNETLIFDSFSLIHNKNYICVKCHEPDGTPVEIFDLAHKDTLMVVTKEEKQEEKKETKKRKAKKTITKEKKGEMKNV